MQEGRYDANHGGEEAAQGHRGEETFAYDRQHDTPGHRDRDHRRITMAGVTPGAVMLYSDQNPAKGIAGAWPALHDIGLIPAWAPRTMQDARIRGRKSVE